MDVYESRLDRSAQRLRRAGAHNVERRALPTKEGGADNAKWLKRQKGAFDRVLVDVPCTGTGTWRRNPDGRWTLRPQDLAELVPKQAAILDAASRLVKPGGGLVYATCSVLPAENERQIEGFLHRHPEFELVPVASLAGGGRHRSAGRCAAKCLSSPVAAAARHRRLFAAAMVRKEASS
jgi:16S rRNA (cytosine967-C5)-methyltransferase